MSQFANSPLDPAIKLSPFPPATTIFKRIKNPNYTGLLPPGNPRENMHGFVQLSHDKTWQEITMSSERKMGDRGRGGERRDVGRTDSRL